MIRLVDVYPYRFKENKLQFLILKRSPDVQYAGRWRMVAGKVKEDEKAWQAGLRELKEETNIRPEHFWVIPSVNHFYDYHTDRIELIPAFAAELNEDSGIILDKEHTEYRWVQGGDAEHFIDWPEQFRLIMLVKSILTNQEFLEEWKIPL